jgi:hypothetical protein
MKLMPLPTEFRNHLLELTGNELQVWLFYYLSAGESLTSYPSNETIATHTGLSERTVKLCKRRLIMKGWMSYTGQSKQPRSAHGHFDVPVMELRLPWLPEWKMTVAAFAEAATVVQMLHHGEEGEEVSDCHRGEDFAPPSVVQSLHPEGLCSGCGSACSSVYISGCASGKLDLDSAQLRPPKEESEKQNQKTEKPKTNPSPAHGRKVRLGKDGKPYPLDFDSWSVERRLEWSDAHNKCGRDSMNLDSVDVLEKSGDPDFQIGPRPSKSDQRQCCAADTETSELCTAMAVHQHTKPTNPRKPNGRKTTFYYCQKHWDEYTTKGWIG